MLAITLRNQSRRVETRIMRPIAALALTLMIALGGIGVSFAPAPASAQTVEAQAYVWANEPSTDAYTPNLEYQFNSTYAENTIARTGVGAYTVSLPGMQATGNTQVTATSGSEVGLAWGTTCEIANEPKSSGGVLNHTVACYDADGAPADSGFLLLHFSGNTFLGSHSAYLWSNDPSAESYTPNEDWQYNYAGGLNTVTRTDVGTYRVTLPGLAVFGGNIQVSAAAATSSDAVPGVSCQVANWNVPTDAAKEVNVVCYDADGTLTDSGFTLLHVVGLTSSDDGNFVVWPTGAYVWVNHGEAADRYTPGKNYQFNGAGLDIEVARTARGSYDVFLPGNAVVGGVFQVTAFGSETPAIACSILNWAFDGDTMIARVICSDANGELADSRFNLAYTYPMP